MTDDFSSTTVKRKAKKLHVILSSTSLVSHVCTYIPIRYKANSIQSTVIRKYPGQAWVNVRIFPIKVTI